MSFRKTAIYQAYKSLHQLPHHIQGQHPLLEEWTYYSLHYSQCSELTVTHQPAGKVFCLFLQDLLPFLFLLLHCLNRNSPVPPPVIPPVPTPGSPPTPPPDEHSLLVLCQRHLVRSFLVLCQRHLVRSLLVLCQRHLVRSLLVLCQRHLVRSLLVLCQRHLVRSFLVLCQRHLVRSLLVLCQLHLVQCLQTQNPQAHICQVQNLFHQSWTSSSVNTRNGCCSTRSIAGWSCANTTWSKTTWPGSGTTQSCPGSAGPISAWYRTTRSITTSTRTPRPKTTRSKTSWTSTNSTWSIPIAPRP
ncbi:uncharacterized protein LOC120802449 isoform X1 [Xiphias gladius]|uniref:uncharacterized protein LOC120802449 isoform X1 n=1 Tax=Xiphias gladius TaxID=8245 RepID=UPI001A97EB38|nr:uncharacterized protein LOC120802449 isoform X1 [Xiphias gladius]